MTARLTFDASGVASLDGVWEFFPGDHTIDDLDERMPEPIVVPALWEAQGHLELDGVAWYRRTFALDDTEGWWTLRFGAVMDVADVWCNGVPLGSHDTPFTPFELDPTRALRPGDNVLAVRVTDPPVDSAEHLQIPHGKQGWANHVFPSRPSLYMTYGGIWLPVTLRRHGPVAVRDVFVNGDPDALAVEAEIEASGGHEPVACRIVLEVLGTWREQTVDLPAGTRATVRFDLGATAAPRWSPEHPVLHEARVSVLAGSSLSDAATARFGLRTVRIEQRDGRPRMVLNGVPYRMRSALVQGFRADELYAEGPRDAILEEVLAAKGMGFNTLRLHIKAFDPAYLEVCDELGMLLECDIPVAEPIDHEDMGADTPLARRCLRATREQVRRDRNHPSIILWSAMNELCLDRLEARAWDRYEAFARTLVAAIEQLDPTRPVIENEWVEPDPGRVFVSPVLTAHWYGRLHADYLATIDEKATAAAELDRPLFVTEFGDWGLPSMPRLEAAPFWDTREIYAAGLAAALWPGSIARFVVETQRYQGLSDRLQVEVFRRHDHIGGYCLTELTDVPQELNGLLDLHRRPKGMAVAEVRRANQVVLPMLRLGSLAVEAGTTLDAPLHIANDGPPLADVTVDVRFGSAAEPVDAAYLLAVDASDLPPGTAAARFAETAVGVRVGDLAGYRAAAGWCVRVPVPEVPGTHDLLLRLHAGGAFVAENRYPVHVVSRGVLRAAVEVVGDETTAGLLEDLGAEQRPGGVLVVAEGGLDETTGRLAAERLAAGGTVVLLAQTPDRAAFCPVPMRLTPVETAWGSSTFHLTTDVGALPSLPRRAVLAGEDATVHATSVVAELDGRPFPDTPVVIAYKPVPGAMTGTIAGAHPVGRGRLVLCQYRLKTPALRGDALARALLAEVVAWGSAPSPVPSRETLVKEDGRQLWIYRWGGRETGSAAG